MRHAIILSLVFLLILAGCAGGANVSEDPHSGQGHGHGQGHGDDLTPEDFFLQNTFQLTFAGKRSGEAYWNADGSALVFQSERDPENPFYQIYVMDLSVGKAELVSTGTGKTTCSWFHPTGEQILFASTHHDPTSKDQQVAELEKRAKGEQSKYSWDFDTEYELYAKRADGLKRLTEVKGYDAEGSWSPDGSKIAWASNRHAYLETADEATRERLAKDASSECDIYIMDADGSNVTRLTDTPGYDGGPFFSPDGSRICFRRFDLGGQVAEIWTVNIDGSDPKQITRLGAMSWAPFYHPSGEYIIFATNLHGFGNFELYIVDANGEGQPIRVTYTDGFDGLPAFSPDGTRLAWTSTRGGGDRSQVFIAEWDHREVSTVVDQQIGGVALIDAAHSREARDYIAERADQNSGESETVKQIRSADIMKHIEYLAAPELLGRQTGTDGERLATQYVADYLERWRLKPAGDNGSWFQEFEFTSGTHIGPGTKLGIQLSEKAKAVSFNVDASWRPLSFSSTGTVESAPVVFVGYGIVAPEHDNYEEYDSYVHADVKGKWVLAFRFFPEDVDSSHRSHLARYANLTHKIRVAREKGAAGIIFVNGPRAEVKHELIPFSQGGTLSGGIAAISVRNGIAQTLLNPAKKTLESLQASLDQGDMVMAFDLPGVRIDSEINLVREKAIGRNVLGRLQWTDTPSESVVVVGAHIDHLGRGDHGSLAKGDETHGIHYGADDNASGIAAMMEIAEYLSHMAGGGSPRDIIFAGWSGEEMGLLGSAHFVKQFAKDGEESLSPRIAACLNMDMVGRLRETLVIQGIGSSSIWEGFTERANAGVGLPIRLQKDPWLPTDATSFYVRGVPIYNAFTGSHDEYHTPRDTPDLINAEGAAQIARLMNNATHMLATMKDVPPYEAMKKPDQGRGGVLRAWLGTVPDYAQEEVKGVRLTGVAKGGPAEEAGVRAGDIIVGLAGMGIENIYDYTNAIGALKIGEETDVIVERDGKRIEMRVTPRSRQ